MEKVILNKLNKKLKWKDKIITIIFRKASIRIYKIGIEEGVNAIL